MEVLWAAMVVVQSFLVERLEGLIDLDVVQPIADWKDLIKRL